MNRATDAALVCQPGATNGNHDETAGVKTPIADQEDGK